MVKISRRATGTIYQLEEHLTLLALVVEQLQLLEELPLMLTLFPLGKRQKIKVAPGTVKFPEDRLLDMHRRDMQKRLIANAGGQKTEVIR